MPLQEACSGRAAIAEDKALTSEGEEESTGAKLLSTGKQGIWGPGEPIHLSLLSVLVLGMGFAGQRDSCYELR